MKNFKQTILFLLFLLSCAARAQVTNAPIDLNALDADETLYAAANTTITLTMPGWSGFTYNWLCNGTNAGSDTNGFVFPLPQGTNSYTVQLTDLSSGVTTETSTLTLIGTNAATATATNVAGLNTNVLAVDDPNLDDAPPNPTSVTNRSFFPLVNAATVITTVASNGVMLTITNFLTLAQWNATAQFIAALAPHQRPLEYELECAYLPWLNHTNYFGGIESSGDMVNWTLTQAFVVGPNGYIIALTLPVTTNMAFRAASYSSAQLTLPTNAAMTTNSMSTIGGTPIGATNFQAK